VFFKRKYSEDTRMRKKEDRLGAQSPLSTRQLLSPCPGGHPS
jgi:hypothetical protein